MSHLGISPKTNGLVKSYGCIKRSNYMHSTFHFDGVYYDLVLEARTPSNIHISIVSDDQSINSSSTCLIYKEVFKLPRNYANKREVFEKAYQILKETINLKHNEQAYI